MAAEGAGALLAGLQGKEEAFQADGTGGCRMVWNRKKTGEDVRRRFFSNSVTAV